MYSKRTLGAPTKAFPSSCKTRHHVTTKQRPPNFSKQIGVPVSNPYQNPFPNFCSNFIFNSNKLGKTMAIALVRSSKNLTNFLTYSYSKPSINQGNGYQWCQQNVKFSRWSNFFRREEAKTIDLPAPPPFVFGSPISSSTTTTALSKSGFVSWYLGMVKSRPVLTKSLTSSVIYTAADLTSQTISLSSGESYDFVRTLRMSGYGIVVLGPSLHYWFNFVSKILPGRDLLTTVKKMALGQIVFGPFMTVVFFSTNASLQGEQMGEIVARLKRDLFPTMVNGAMYWPLCDFITFRFAPVHLQPLVSNSFSYLWTVYMTYMASLERAST